MTTRLVAAFAGRSADPAAQIGAAVVLSGISTVVLDAPTARPTTTSGRPSSTSPGAPWSRPLPPRQGTQHGDTVLPARPGSFRRRGRVVVIWLLVLAALGGGAAAFKGPRRATSRCRARSRSGRIDALQREFPEASGATGTIVVAAPEGQQLTTPANQAAVAALVKEASALPGAVGALDPFDSGAVSQDKRYALIQVQFTAGPTRSPTSSAPRTRTAARPPPRPGCGSSTAAR